MEEFAAFPWQSIASFITILVLLSPLIKPVRTRLGKAFGEMFTGEVVKSVDNLTKVVAGNYKESKRENRRVARELLLTKKKTDEESLSMQIKLAEIEAQTTETNGTVKAHTEQIGHILNAVEQLQTISKTDHSLEGEPP